MPDTCPVALVMPVDTPLTVLPSDAHTIAALNAQVAFLAQQLRSALGHLDGKNYCGATRVVEFALNSIGKMPTHRPGRRKK